MKSIAFVLFFASAVALGGEPPPPTPPPSNVRVNDPTTDTTSNDTQSMSAIVRVNGTTLLAAFADSGSYTPSGNTKFTGWSRSTDNGATWVDKGTLPNSTLGDAADNRLALSSSTGTVFLSTLPLLNSTSVQLFRSTDGGVTFATAVNAAPGVTAVDFPDLAVDNYPSGFNGRVYVAYRDFGTANGLALSHSTDDGLTWAATGVVTGGQGAALVVEPSHAVDFFYLLQGTPSSLHVARSTDGGSTFSGTSITNLATATTNGDLGFPYRTNSFPHAAVNPSSGNLYLAYNDPVVATDPGNIYFRRSTDGGVTWSSALKLNDDATNRGQFHPSIAVTPDGLHVFVAWYDRRSDPADTALEYWGVIGTISGGAILGRNFKISSVAFQPVYGGDPIVNPKFMTDYESAVADDTGFDVLWGDGRDPSTFSGATRKNMNVRYSRIPTPLRGDVNGDFVANLADVFYLVNLLFASGPAPTSQCQADVDHSGSVDFADVFFLINYLFAGGAVPAGGC